MLLVIESGITLKIPSARKIVRKIVGWLLIAIAVLFFVVSLTLVPSGKIGPLSIGLFLSLLIFIFGWSLQADLENPRKLILAIFKKHFPKCPICKSEKGFQVRGFLPTTQFVRCENCGAEWYSPDFTSNRDLRSLRLSRLPNNAEAYAEFITHIKLRLRKFYPTKLWLDLMNGKELSPQMNNLPWTVRIRKLKPTDLISTNIRIIGISFTLSLVASMVGYLFFKVSTGDSYILFCLTFFTVFFSLTKIR